MSTAELLRKAAAALERGESPLTTPFLGDNDVSLDQCFTLAEQLAIGARIVAAGIERPRSLAGQAYVEALIASSLTRDGERS